MGQPIRGAQIATGTDGIATGNLADDILAASASGRAKMASGFFDSSTFSAKVAASAVADDRLAVSYIKTDGTRAFTGDQSLGGFKVTNLAAPVSANDAARKTEVDAVAAGLSWKDAVRAATTAA